MRRKTEKECILILGGSGFIGHALYRELQSYYKVYGTYCTQSGNFSDNHMFYHYRTEDDNLMELLQELQPTVIISALVGNYKAQLKAHSQIADYGLQNKDCSVLFLSSSEVFDAKSLRPSYEKDIPLSESELGKFKISVERILLKTIPEQTTILRLPMVLGINSPIIFHLRQCIRHQATFEVFPNLVVSATTINKVCQQVHYIINQSLHGIYHLASNDMIHHNDLFSEITAKIGSKKPIFKNAYSSNEDRYKALLPKYNILAETYQITIDEVIEESSLSEEIVSIV